ncbi:hypothetical protein LVY72_21845 [Arthrobacter sp. I2-34]|uniref:Uncharacterized protein n=1 Tax=Arthrobacter hankyongi TaxID=2904801 RepID=A0ABS9LCZ9_9MICC|nr:hypothetical protein [Arthrobacter hankyongi]MCG2624536.1 hypothetical protein [Arthrobacter hankyongi]
MTHLSLVDGPVPLLFNLLAALGALWLLAGNLPVLVMIHGRPGGPGAWISSGNLAAAMDNYAAHHGLARWW